MEKKKFLVLGHPRSGTGFMVKLLRQHGYHIGHEVMGRDGISSWMFVVEDYQVFTDKLLNRKDFEFDYVLMNIRHPLHIVTSSYFTENPNKPSMDYRKKHLELEGLNREEMAVKSVLDWYKCIELQRPHLKICIDKNPEEKMFYFLKRFENINLEAPIPKIEGKVNPRNHANLDYTFLKERCDKSIMTEFENFCSLYGYELSNDSI
jgi:hypothetical protein